MKNVPEKILDLSRKSIILKGLKSNTGRSPTVTIFCVRKPKTDGEGGTREGRRAVFGLSTSPSFSVYGR